MKYKIFMLNYSGGFSASSSSSVCSLASDYKQVGHVSMLGWEMIAVDEWRRRRPKSASMTLDCSMVMGDYGSLNR